MAEVGSCLGCRMKHSLMLKVVSQVRCDCLIHTKRAWTWSDTYESQQNLLGTLHTQPTTETRRLPQQSHAGRIPTALLTGFNAHQKA